MELNIVIGPHHRISEKYEVVCKSKISKPCKVATTITLYSASVFCTVYFMLNVKFRCEIIVGKNVFCTSQRNIR